jgi:hypothetical protein
MKYIFLRMISALSRSVEIKKHGMITIFLTGSVTDFNRSKLPWDINFLVQYVPQEI